MKCLKTCALKLNKILYTFVGMLQIYVPINQGLKSYNDSGRKSFYKVHDQKMKSELKFLEDIYYSLGFRALGNAFYTAINNGLISFLFFACSFLCICDFTKFLYNNIMKIEKKTCEKTGS